MTRGVPVDELLEPSGFEGEKILDMMAGPIELKGANLTTEEKMSLVRALIREVASRAATELPTPEDVTFPDDIIKKIEKNKQEITELCLEAYQADPTGTLDELIASHNKHAKTLIETLLELVSPDPDAVAPDVTTTAQPTLTTSRDEIEVLDRALQELTTDNMVALLEELTVEQVKELIKREVEGGCSDVGIKDPGIIKDAIETNWKAYDRLNILDKDSYLRAVLAHYIEDKNWRAAG